jgi:hypothetical protein
MKKLLLVLLALPMLGFGQLGDYYTAKGHPKAKGLNFQIKKPLGFEQMEGDRPNIVQKWIKNPKDNNTMVQFMVLVKNMPQEMQIQKSEWIQYLKFENGVEELVNIVGKNVSKGKYYVLDRYPGIYYENMEVGERMGFTFTFYTKTVQVYLEKHHLTISMTSADKGLLEENTKLFHLLANSVIFPDQYGK